MMSEITIDAIYQDGVIKPLESIDLPDNILLKVQITRRDTGLKGGLAKYKGILAGKGEFSLEEIHRIIESATEYRLEKLTHRLNESTE